MPLALTLVLTIAGAVTEAELDDVDLGAVCNVLPPRGCGDVMPGQVGESAIKIMATRSV